MSMLETAEIVAERYGVSREAQDAYALDPQQRTAHAQAEGRFEQEVVPVTATMTVTDKQTGETGEREVTLRQDEGNRPRATLAGLQKLQPVFKGGQQVKAGKSAPSPARTLGAGAPTTPTSPARRPCTT